MSAGRPPKPTTLKVLEGNRGKRALNGKEPDPDYLDQLEAPAWLPDEAKAVWSELAFKMRKAKLLTVVDVPAMESMCVAIATYRRATLAAMGAELLDKESDARDPAAGAAQAKSRPMGFISGARGADEAAPGDATTAAQGAVHARAQAGGKQLNPWLIVQSMAYKQAVGLMRDFGMMPAARARVLVDPQLGLFGNGDEKAKTYFT